MNNKLPDILIQTFPDPLATISPEGIIQKVNLAMIKMLGLTGGELTGTLFADYFADPVKARYVIGQVFGLEVVKSSIMSIGKSEGPFIDVVFRGYVFDGDKRKGIGAVITLHSIASKKQPLIYARSLIEASLDPLFTINTEGKITDMNEASINITDVSRDKLKGTDFSEYFTEPHKAREIYKEVFDKGFVTNYPLTIRDGILTEVLFNGSVYKDDSGIVLGAVVVARDISAQKRIESELTEAKIFAELSTGIAEDAKTKAEHATITAENAVKAKQQFLSNMSHEIRTPMNAIIGFTKVLLKSGLTSKQKEYLMAIKMSGDALIVLINDILDLAKVDAGKMVFEQTPFKMALSISAMLHIFESKILEKNLKLEQEYDNNIPEVLIGDPLRLHQIILNLLSNAVKFTSKGTILVSTRLLREDKDEVHVEFTIKDTGIGIAPNKLEKIFENFQQATSGTSRIFGGTGLGLAIVKQLIEHQGGRISVVSVPNEGSTFSFVLSFLKTNVETEVVSDDVVLDPEIKDLKILVVEDIAINQLLMITILEDFGFMCDIASNGKIAIEMIRLKQYDLILMDLQMPVMNGFEATDYIRNRMKLNIPIVALTADVTTVDLAKCRSVGMNDYIAKPVEEKLLYRKILNLVQGSDNVSETQQSESENKQLTRCTDMNYLNQRTKSNPKLMMEMIFLYLEQTPLLINTMKKSLSEKDWNLLYSSAHKMIPSFSIMGISVDFENMARKIQDYANTQQQADGISEMVDKLEFICNQACRELKEEFNIIKSRTDELKS